MLLVDETSEQMWAEMCQQDPVEDNNRRVVLACLSKCQDRTSMQLMQICQSTNIGYLSLMQQLQEWPTHYSHSFTIPDNTLFMSFVAALEKCCDSPSVMVIAGSAVIVWRVDNYSTTYAGPAKIDD